MITKLDTIQGGVACVGDTRIPVWLLERERRRGSRDDVLLSRFAALTPESLAAVWQFVKENAAEIEENIRLDGPKVKAKAKEEPRL